MIAPPCTFTLAKTTDQQAFYIDARGSLMHCYQVGSKPWVKEMLGSGWDPDSGLAHDVSPGGADQVWGWLSSGHPAQVYWSGRQWVTQPLP